MAQRFPTDYDGILAGAPAIHFEKLGLGQTWPQVRRCGVCVHVCVHVCVRVCVHVCVHP